MSDISLHDKCWLCRECDILLSLFSLLKCPLFCLKVGQNLLWNMTCQSFLSWNLILLCTKLCTSYIFQPNLIYALFYCCGCCRVWPDSCCCCWRCCVLGCELGWRLCGASRSHCLACKQAGSTPGKIQAIKIGYQSISSYFWLLFSSVFCFRCHGKLQTLDSKGCHYANFVII